MSESNSLGDRLRRSFVEGFPKAVRKNWKIIISVTILFFITIGTAFVANREGNNPINQTIEKQTKGFQKKVEEEMVGKRSALELTGFFIKNNLVTSIQIIGLGVVFGLFPLYGLLFNSSIIGYLVSETSLSTLQILASLLPHGVFELTGYIIAVSCGVKLGIGSIKSLLNQKVKPLKKAGKEIADLLPPIILLIIIAGFIEGFLGILPIMNSQITQIALIGTSLVSLIFILLWMTGKLTKPYDQ